MSKEITFKDYWKEILAIANEIAEDTKNEGEDREWAFERLWETIDGHEWIIYAWAQPYVLAQTNNDDAYFEMTGEDSVPGNNTGQVLMTLAFYAMHQDTAETLERVLSEMGIE